MFSIIKGYIMMGVTAVVAIFVTMYKMRGTKVDNLEKELKGKEEEIIVAARTVENAKKAAAFVADNRVAKTKAEVDNEDDTNKYDPSTKFYI